MSADGITLERLTDILGVDGVTTLSFYWGGRRLYIPAQVPPHHPLAQHLGQARAAALAAEFGRDTLVSVPVGLGRIAEIHRLKREHNHLSHADIAHRLRCSRRTIIRALKKHPKLLPQSAPSRASSAGAASANRPRQLDILDWLEGPREALAKE